MNCKKCGTKLIDDEHFCRGCGSLVSELIAQNMVEKIEEKPMFEPITPSDDELHIMHDVEMTNEVEEKHELENPNLSFFIPVVDEIEAFKEPTIEENKPVEVALDVVPVFSVNSENIETPVVEETPVIEATPVVEEVKPEFFVAEETTNEDLLNKTMSIPTFVPEEEITPTVTENISETNEESTPSIMDSISEKVEDINTILTTAVADANEEIDALKPKKSKTKVLLPILIVLLVAAILYGVFMTLNPKTKTVKEIVEKDIFKVTVENFTFDINDSFKYQIVDNKLNFTDKDSTWLAVVDVIAADYTKVLANKDAVITEIEKAKYKTNNVKELTLGTRKYLTIEVDKDAKKALVSYTRATQVYTFEVILITKDKTINTNALNEVSKVLDTAVFGVTPLEVVNTDFSIEVNDQLFR